MLSIEQETIRVHGRAARALANQSIPLSVCTILKDEEIYNQIDPIQEAEKEKTTRTRYNGRQFLSWLQDVDDKYDKIKVGWVTQIKDMFLPWLDFQQILIHVAHENTFHLLKNVKNIRACLKSSMFQKLTE